MKNTRTFAFLGILTALEIVLARFVQIPFVLFGTFTDKISLGFLPVAMGGALFGFWGGGLVGGLGDMLRALILPQGGAWNPLFTISAACRGTLYGAVLHKKMNVVNIIIACVLVFVLCDCLLLSFFITISYGNPFLSVLLTRLPTTAVKLVVNIAGLTAVGMPLRRKLDYVRK